MNDSKLAQVRMRLHPSFDDARFKQRTVAKLLKRGERVAVVIMLRGRELPMRAEAEAELAAFVRELGAPIAEPIHVTGRMVRVVLGDAAPPLQGAGARVPTRPPKPTAPLAVAIEPRP